MKDVQKLAHPWSNALSNRPGDLFLAAFPDKLISSYRNDGGAMKWDSKKTLDTSNKTETMGTLYRPRDGRHRQAWTSYFPMRPTPIGDSMTVHFYPKLLSFPSTALSHC